MNRWMLSVAVLAGLQACSQSQTRATESATLEPGVVAQVEKESITQEQLREVMRVQNLPRQLALDKLIFDALLAQRAKEKYSEKGLQPSVERAVLARALLEQLANEARKKGPPTSSEVEVLSKRRWIELDRPTTRRVRHALVVLNDKTPREQAKALAKELYAATRKASTAKAFEAQARTIEPGKLDVRVQALPPLAEDTRFADPEKPELKADSRFTAAVYQIPEVGGVSEVIESSFGFHVIYLEEILPPNKPSSAKKLKAVTGEAYAQRARHAQEALVRELGATTKVDISRAFLELSGHLWNAR